MTPITSTKPYMVAPGNHEGSSTQSSSWLWDLNMLIKFLILANCDNGGTSDKANHIKVSIFPVPAGLIVH